LIMSAAPNSGATIMRYPSPQAFSHSGDGKARSTLFRR
jgi:hypothetical protein